MTRCEFLSSVPVEGEATNREFVVWTLNGVSQHDHRLVDVERLTTCDRDSFAKRAEGAGLGLFDGSDTAPETPDHRRSLRRRFPVAGDLFAALASSGRCGA